VKQYQQDAKRTVSNSFHSANVPPSALAQFLYVALKSAPSVDQAKKSLFYGRPLTGSAADVAAVSWGGAETYSGLDIHILHAILGIFTEAAELVELLYRAISNGEEIDHTKLLNEAGDVQWYQALLYNAIGTDFEAVGAGNIAKLQARYPDKFVDQEVRDEKHEDEAMIKAVRK
jgi:hypothetical protein